MSTPDALRPVTAEHVARIKHAAELIHTRATAATPGPWWVHRDNATDLWYGDQARTYGLDENPHQFDDADWDTWEQTTGQLAHGELREPHDAIHIAGMDPTLALALADWLVYEATKAALGWNGQSDRALAVADAYLGP